MANYNCEKYLPESIESILNQSFKDLELIIIDDCSTDNSLKIIKNYGEKDKRIKIIKNKHNSGASQSRNNGLTLAEGEYIAILDSDDIALIDRLKIQYDFLTNNKSFFLVGGQAYNIDENSRIISKTHMETSREGIEKKLPYQNCFYHSSIMFRNEKIMYRPNFMKIEDYDFFLRLLSLGKKMINLNKILLKYRIRKNSLSHLDDGSQDFFGSSAQEFYNQRVISGKDNYDLIDFLKIDYLNNLDKKKLLEKNISSNYNSFSYKSLKKNYKGYKSEYGFNLNLFMLYFLSMFGVNFNRIIRRLFSFY